MRYLLPIVLLLVAPAHADEIRSVVVSGTAEIMTVPDVAVLRFSVEERARTLEEARQRVDATVMAVARLMNERQIPPEHVSTAALVVQPDYQWQPDTRTRSLLGYVVTRMMSVRLADLTQLGATLEGILALGVNRVEPPAFDTTERDDLELKALADAALDARRRAEVLARALDARVGKVRNLSADGPPDIYPAREGALRAVAADESAGSYQPGQIRISSHVTATFDLLTD